MSEDFQPLVCDDGIGMSKRMVLLQCADGYRLDVKETVALQLHAHKDEINSNFGGKPIRYLPGITSKTLFKLIDYCKNLVDPSTSKGFGAEFARNVDPLTLFDLIQAAHQFKIKSLMDLTCRELVNKVKDKTYEEIMKEFNIDQAYAQLFDKRFRLNTGEGIQPALRALHSITGNTEIRNGESILRQRGKETLINKSLFVDVQYSPLVARQLGVVERRNLIVDRCVQKLMVSGHYEELSEDIRLLDKMITADLALAVRLSPVAALRLLEIVQGQKANIQLKCWAVSTLSSATFEACGEVIKDKAIPVLVNLLTNFDPLPRVAGVIALTRLANASSVYIPVIVCNGALEKLLTIVNKPQGMRDIICHVAKFLAVVCRGYDLPFQKVAVARAILEHLFKYDFDKNYHIVQACNTLQYLSYKRWVETTVFLLYKLVECICSKRCAISGSALGVVGNIARWGEVNEIQFLIEDGNLLKCLATLVSSCKQKKFWKEACHIISNIAARTEISIKDMHDVNLIAPLCSLLEKDESDVKMEAAWALFNGIYGNRNRQIDEYPE